MLQGRGSRCFCTLPRAVRGNASTRTNARGILNDANAARQRSPRCVRIEGFFADDVGDGNFAADLVRHADDGGFGDFFLLEKKLFDLAGIDIEATGDDQVAAPALERVVLVGGSFADVAGAKVAIDERGLGGFVAPPVACEDVRPADE